MEDSQLKPRRQFLLDVQNRDGGWGYFPGKQSWLEPTVWAALALRGTPAAERAGALIRSWAVPEGGWRSAAEVPQVTWTSALGLTFYCANAWEDNHLHRSLARILHTVGAEGSFLMQVHHKIYPDINDIDYGLQGWPFLAGNTSWVEPTAHTIIALRNAVSFLGPGRVPYLGLEKRVSTAEQMLMERRTEDGGWNCGNRRVWGVPLPSYPETTGLALIALRGNSNLDLSASLRTAQRYWRDTRSPLARVWLAISLRLYGKQGDALSEQDSRPSQDIALAALQALASSPENDRLFLPGAKKETA